VPLVTALRYVLHWQIAIRRFALAIFTFLHLCPSRRVDVNFDAQIGAEISRVLNGETDCIGSVEIGLTYNDTFRLE